MALRALIESATVADLLVEQKSSFEGLIAAAETASGALRQQRDALLAQIAPLQVQVSAINAQIAEAEGVEAPKARRVVQILDRVARGGPVGRFL